MSEIYILSIIFGDNDSDDWDTDDNIINLYYSKSIKKVEKMKEQLLNMFDKSKFYINGIMIIMMTTMLI